jgi:amidophosphoribosyltransferase
MQPDQAQRQRTIGLKFNPLVQNLRDKSVVIIDDSIVRGNTLSHLIAMIRQANPKYDHTHTHTRTHPAHTAHAHDQRHPFMRTILTISRVQGHPRAHLLASRPAPVLHGRRHVHL